MPASGGARSHPPVSSSAFLAQNNNPSAMDAARKGIRRKFKAPTVLNIVLAGAKGMGKSTFAKTFLETCDLSLCDEAVRRDIAKFCLAVNAPLVGKARRAREAQSQKPMTLAGIEIRAGDSLDSLDAVLQTHLQLQIHASLDRSARSALATTDGEHRLRKSSDAPSTTSVSSFARGRATRMLQLSLIDCPGSELPRISGGKVSAADELAIELALQPLLEIIQGRFSASLGEEVKVSRTKQEDNHIHAVLYFIDPQSLIPDRPPPRSKADKNAMPDTEVGLRLGTSDVRVIQRLATRTNVVPVLAQADRLTEAETARARLGIRKSFLEMGLLTTTEDNAEADDDNDDDDEEDDDDDDDDDVANGLKLSKHHCHVDPDLEWPYALVLPEAEPLPPPDDKDSDVLPPSISSPGEFNEITSVHFQRRFKWGTLDVLNRKHCDFRQLRSSLLFNDIDEYKETTQMYYEEYRSERLQ